MAEISAAFYWDPRIHQNACAYHSKLSKSNNRDSSISIALDSSVSSNIYDPDLATLQKVEPGNSTGNNFHLLLQHTPVLYAYSSIQDIVQQLFTLSKTLASQSVLNPTSSALEKPPSVFLIFFSFDALEIEKHLPVLRFISFTASHFPSVLTVLYDDDHTAAALAASNASSFAGPITKPLSISSTNDTSSPNPSSSNSTSTALASTSISASSPSFAAPAVIPEIDISAHVHHILKTCGVAVFSPPVLSDSILKTVLAKSSEFPDAEAAVVAHINSSVSALSSAHKQQKQLLLQQQQQKSNSSSLESSSPPEYISEKMDNLPEPAVQYDVVDQSSQLFSRKYDYAIVNFITCLEMYHSRHLLESDKVFTRLDPQINNSSSNLLKPSNSSFDPSLYPTIFHISQSRIDFVASLIADWDFRAHDLSYNDLLFAAFLMFKHAFTMQNVKPVNSFNTPTMLELVISDPALFKFLLVVRDSYRPSNPYHNFRHAIDVLQASFYFLIQLNSLPQYSKHHISRFDSNTPEFLKSQVSILNPVEALTLLIIAIGHDVGHPGVTNMFLTNAKTPIAEAFSYKSILESYHSAAFQRILEMYWPSTQSNQVCQLIIRSVQATDMGLHFDYMKKAEKTFEMIQACGASEYLTRLDNAMKEKAGEKETQAGSDKKEPSSSSTNPHQEKLDFQTLACCLLIKCADISNVVRTLEISSKWGVVLTKEFSQVEILEIALKMKEPKPAAPVSNTQGATKSAATTTTSSSLSTSPSSAAETKTSETSLEKEKETKPSATLTEKETKPAKESQVRQDEEGYTVPVLSLAKGQLFFINTFAKPLFELVSMLFPELAYTIRILESNAAVWNEKVKELEEEG